MKPVKIYQDCVVCEIGKRAKIFMDKQWWTTSVVQTRRDTPQGLPRFETKNTLYQPDAHDGGDPLNFDYWTDKMEKALLDLNDPYEHGGY